MTVSHPVLALGTAVVTASGCVWYVPALADLRAGTDRPVPARSAAAACLSGWSTAAALALLFLVADGWWTPGAVAGAGAALTAGLAARAAVHRRRGARETALTWAQLGRPRPQAGPAGGRGSVAAVLAAGLAAAAAVAVLLTASAPSGTPPWLAATAPLAVVALALALAYAVRTVRPGRGRRGGPVGASRRG
ncbi:hypothetical protein [Streptomyces tagetis]|uniref:Uncharacterized protein n=1 Tax=Streptomyces tagetis TaxID=2820809 RepID=A0A941B7J7_9ACTN|nr:hypothetical protein [Streptomyces sp. RG38]MBQ0827533.1 hypothetical protein [Streptomyces sp. RG38]